MAKGHWIFIIAKINGQRYRSLACLHFDTLFSASTVGIAVSIIAFLQSEKNRPRLEYELAYARTLTEEQWKSENTYWNQPMFPFLATCLIDAVLSSGSSSKTSLLPWNSVFDIESDEEGMSVFDITKYEVSHCFVQLKPTTTRRDMSQVMVPLSSSEYIRLYHQDNWHERHRALFNALSEARLIDADVLNELWQDQLVGARIDRFKSRRGPHQRGIGRNETQSSLLAAKVLQKKDAARYAYHARVEDLLQETSVEELGSKIQHLPGTAFRTFLYDNPHYVTDHVSGIKILSLALRRHPKMDLKPFVSMTGEQVIELMDLIEAGQDEGHMSLFSGGTFDFLDISFNQKINIEDLRQILDGKRVATLYAWNNPLLPTAELKELVKSGNIGVLHDSRLYLEAFDEIRSDTASLSHIQHTIPVSQLIWMYSSVSPELVEEDPKDIDGCDIEALYNALLRSTDRGERWTSELYVRLLNLELREAHLGVAQLFGFVTRFLQQLPGMTLDDASNADLEMELVPRIPLMLSTRNPREAFEVHPIPRGMFFNRVLFGSFASDPFHPISSDEWTVIIIQEPELARFRYAFISRGGDGCLRVLDAHDFAHEMNVGPNFILHQWISKVQQVMVEVKDENTGNLLEVRAEVKPCEEEMVEKVIELTRRCEECREEIQVSVEIYREGSPSRDSAIDSRVLAPVVNPPTRFGLDDSFRNIHM
ncbi:uncharacterized protein F4822DRAFT_416032 [Hypoxylon trugodes]|uniref:uncharacterized protein n=1 Tax=Hypoxylon trugodes TaxID=326681 RepID=UPI00219D9696|nr:uncharacterized protein F4822DRAFT_416032 [Hypoxylon trugodes]KAI1384706.1 hypothetical protein F4822DRAFT_416032 [Hypoxylon trugodes]